MNAVRYMASGLGFAVSAAVCVLLSGIGMPPAAMAEARANQRVVLSRQVPAAVAGATLLGGVADNQPLSIVITLPLRNQAQLKDLLHGLYNPSDPRYGHYLTPQQFAGQFGPTQADYDAVIAFVKSSGLSVTKTWPNHVLLNVSGPAGAIGKAFAVHLLSYRASDGRLFHMPDASPSIPSALGGIVSGVVGLDNSVLPKPGARRFTGLKPTVFGTGPGLGLAPSDTQTAYNMSSVALNGGSGQSVALFELDTYIPSDISQFESEFSISPGPSVQTVSVDGGVTTPGAGQAEVTMDIDLAMELAPSLSNIYVYEAPLEVADVVPCYEQIATDDLAKIVSTSWGIDELSGDNEGTNTGEATAFAQMAAQGQTMYAASGDSGAFDDSVGISVDDPASQPNVTGVGGTDLAINSDGSYQSESSWGDPLDVKSEGPLGAGSGGGVSKLTPLPPYQVGIADAASLASDIWRNVPDVSLYGDFDTGGYSIYIANAPYDGWVIYNGTSAAAPLWASFTADVDATRVSGNQPTLGFASPSLYQIAAGPDYATDFHDVNDGTTNLYYPAVTGYDLSTGWGSFNGANLAADLTNVLQPAAPTSLSAVAGDGSVTLTWDTVIGASGYNVNRGAAINGETFLASTPRNGYVDSGLTDGTTYYYTVMAVTPAGTSVASGETFAIPQAAPPIPNGLAATSGSHGVILNWTSVSAAQTYNVYRGLVTGSEGTTPIATNISPTSFTDTGLLNGTSYFYTVTSVGQTESAQSTEVNAIPIAAPKPPFPATIASNSLTNGLVLCAPLNEYGGSFITNLADGSIANIGSGWTWSNSTPEGAALLASSPAAPIIFSPAPGAAPTGNMTVFVIGYANSANPVTTYPYFAQDQGTSGMTNWGVVLDDGALENYGGSSATQLIDYAVRSDVAPKGAGATGPTETDISGSTVGQLVHLAYTRQETSGAEYFYVNGLLAGGTIDDSLPLGTSNPDVWALGGDLDPTFPTLNGYLSYVLVWNRALTPAEIQEVNADPYNLLVAPPPPPPPTNLMASVVPGGVVLSWTAAANATSYNILVGTAPGQEQAFEENVTETQITITSGLTLGQRYYFEVVAEGPNGESNPSNEVSAIPGLVPPAAPASLTATPGNTQVILNWSPSGGATSYNVFEGASPGGESATPLSPPASGTSYTVTGLTNGFTYYFTVDAVGPSGTGVPSAEASAVPTASTPSAPSSLTATAGNGAVTLNWTAATSAGSYSVYLGTLSGQEGATAVAGNITTTNTTITGLQNGTTYFFTVAAFNSNGGSGASNEASATPEPPIPAAPADLTASAGNTQIVLTWAPSTYATSYSVFEATASGDEGTTPVKTGVTGTSTTISGLVNDTAYYFTVTASDVSGQSSPSREVSVTPLPTVPLAPANLTATAANTSATLNWTASAGATSYNVYSSTVSGGEGTTPLQSGLTAPSTTVDSLFNGTTYYFTVIALNSGGASLSSSEVAVTPEPPVPSAPANLTASSGNGSVTLSWTASQGAVSYNIYMGTGSGGEGATPSVTGITATQDTITGLQNAHTYYFVVTAVNSGGESAPSSEVSAAPGIQVAIAPGVQFLSVPYDYPGTSLDALFGYSPVNLYVWSPSQIMYIGTPSPPADQLRIGVGYWANLPQAVTFAPGVAADPGQDFSISLSEGWNQVGDPFLTSAPISALTFNGETFTAASTGATPLIGAAIWSYSQSTNGGLGGYLDATSGDGMLDVGLGYWVYATANTVMVVPHP